MRLVRETKTTVCIPAGRLAGGGRRAADGGGRRTADGGRCGETAPSSPSSAAGHCSHGTVSSGRGSQAAALGSSSSSRRQKQQQQQQQATETAAAAAAAAAAAGEATAAVGLRRVCRAAKSVYDGSECSSRCILRRAFVRDVFRNDRSRLALRCTA